MSASSSSICKTESTVAECFDLGAAVPCAYGQTELVALARDPFCIFSYWEVTNQTRRQIQQDFGSQIFHQSSAILRLYELSVDGKQQKSCIDFPINLDTNAHYIQLPKEGSVWQLELGLKLKDGRFISLIFSNIIQTPRLSDQGYSLQQWMQIWQGNQFLNVWKQDQTNSSMFAKCLQQQQSFSEKSSWKKPTS